MQDVFNSKFVEPSIAVIIPCYNVKDFVQEALESVLKQNLLPDEVIVVDDGSSDETPEIIRRYSDVPNWKFFRTENNGLGPSRNLGRVLAKSEYVYFFDSDDLLESDFIARMHQVIKEYGRPDVIMFAGQSFYESGFDIPVSSTYKRSVIGVFGRNTSLITKLAHLNESWAPACLYVTKSKLWSENRLLYPPILHEDEAVLFPLLALSEKTVVLPDVYFRRRVRSGSIMTSAVDSRNVSGILHVIHETMEFMVQKPILAKPDIGAWRARVAQFGFRYLLLCRKTGVRISWATIAGSMIAARSLGYPLRIATSCFPRALQGVLRRVRLAMKAA
jgi:glycosyltransferase involved in cell wall biosynthesis